VRSSCLLTRIKLLRNPLSASCIICCEYYASGACLCIAGLMCRTFGQCIPSSAMPCTTCCGGAAAGECLCMPCHFCLPIITDCTKAAPVLQMMCGACRYVLCTFTLLPACCLTKRNAALAPCRRRAASAQVRATCCACFATFACSAAHQSQRFPPALQMMCCECSSAGTASTWSASTAGCCPVQTTAARPPAHAATRSWHDAGGGRQPPCCASKRAPSWLARRQR